MGDDFQGGGELPLFEDVLGGRVEFSVGALFDKLRFALCGGSRGRRLLCLFRQLTFERVRFVHHERARKTRLKKSYPTH